MEASPSVEWVAQFAPVTFASSAEWAAAPRHLPGSKLLGAFCGRNGGLPEDRIDWRPPVVLPPTGGTGHATPIRDAGDPRLTGVVDAVYLGPVVYVDASATGANDGTSWTDAFNDLQSALEIALLTRQTRGIGPQIWVADGMYRPSALTDPGDLRSATFELVNGVTIYGGFAGGEMSLAERDLAANHAVLSGDLAGDDQAGGGNGENAYHVVSAIRNDATAVLDGFTIVGGNADGPDASYAQIGGGLINVGGSPTITDCRFMGNTAFSGGGMANSFGDPVLTNCLFSGNTAAVDGGGMFNDEFSRPTLNQCTFSRNLAGGEGGGVRNGLSGVNSPRLKNCILWGNVADADGDAGGPYTDADAQIDSASTTGNGIPVVDYSCIQDLEGATLIGKGNIGGDPRFRDPDGPDGIPGTLDDDLELGRFSACADAGDSKAVPADVTDADGDGDTAERLPRDLAGKSRLVDDGEVKDTGRGFPPVVDMGSYERIPDCNENGVPDSADVGATSPDCNYNSVPDECEIEATSPAPGGPFYCPVGDLHCDPDCNENGIPDVCDGPDCNENDVPDMCDMMYCGGEPWCTDCNGNGWLDSCDIESPFVYCPTAIQECDDCNDNGTPDLCDLILGTSQDIDGNWIPDECVRPLLPGNYWTDDIWGLPDPGYPDNLDGVPNLHVTLDLYWLTLNKTVEIESLRLNYGTRLDVNWPFPPSGDLSTRAGRILTRGELFVQNHYVHTVGMRIAESGVLKTDGATAVDLAGGPLVIDFGALLEPLNPLSPMQGSISAGRIALLPTYCGAQSQATITDGMSVTTNGDFVIDGRDVQCLVRPGREKESARGGKTPPILKLPGPQYELATAKQVRLDPVVHTPLFVNGDLRILNSGNVCVGCTADTPCFCPDCYPDNCAAYTRSGLAGDFDNASRYASLFNWTNGGMLLAGGSVQDPNRFEVAGIDLGPILEGFATGEQTNTESFTAGDTHTNFAMGMVEVAPGGQVAFKNEHVNTAGSAGCAEALYTRVLKVGGDAAVNLLNANVYYEVLELDETASITQSGCGKLRRVCWTAPGPGDNCQTDILVAHDGPNDFSNICAGTDGPNPVVCETGPVEFGADVWYAYTATCSGTLTVSLCESAGFDGVLALYTDGNDTCECPMDASRQHGPGNNDGCSVVGGPPVIRTTVQEGNCYTIRIAGRESGVAPGQAAQGQGQFDITCGCVHADPPAAEPSVPDVGFGTRVRYLAFSAPAEWAGREQAIRVRLTDLPFPFEYAEGRVMWVGEPVDISEVAGKPDETPPTFKVADLQCDPFFADWTTYGTVYVRSTNLVPGGLHDIQAIDSTCLLTTESEYSAPRPVMLSKWGDTVGASSAASPQGTVDFTDISSVVDKFKNLPGAPAKSRVDVAPARPDGIVDFGDIPCVVDAFRGLPYPYPGPPPIGPCQ